MKNALRDFTDTITRYPPRVGTFSEIKCEAINASVRCLRQRGSTYLKRTNGRGAWAGSDFAVFRHGDFCSFIHSIDRS